MLVNATSFPISGGRVPGEAREKRRGMERLENQEKTSEQDAKKLRPKATVLITVLMTITRILVAPSMYVSMSSNVLSFTSFPISGGMVPGK